MKELQKQQSQNLAMYFKYIFFSQIWYMQLNRIRNITFLKSPFMKPERNTSIFE